MTGAARPWPRRVGAVAAGAAAGLAAWAALRLVDAEPPLPVLPLAGAVLGALAAARSRSARRGEAEPGESRPVGALSAPEPRDEPPVALDLGDTIDLHSFAPRDVVPVARAFVDDAAARGLPRVRLVHGKGKGVQRRAVHAMLAAHPAVLDWEQAGGNWGATVVRLRAPGDAG